MKLQNKSVLLEQNVLNKTCVLALTFPHKKANTLYIGQALNVTRNE